MSTSIQETTFKVQKLPTSAVDLYAKHSPQLVVSTAMYNDEFNKVWCKAVTGQLITMKELLRMSIPGFRSQLSDEIARALGWKPITVTEDDGTTRTYSHKLKICILICNKDFNDVIKSFQLKLV